MIFDSMAAIANIYLLLLCDYTKNIVTIIKLLKPMAAF